jgi:hypothetical protein
MVPNTAASRANGVSSIAHNHSQRINTAYIARDNHALACLSKAG